MMHRVIQTNDLKTATRGMLNMLLPPFFSVH